MNDAANQNDGDVATTILVCTSGDKRVSLWTVSETQQVDCAGCKQMTVHFKRCDDMHVKCCGSSGTCVHERRARRPGPLRCTVERESPKHSALYPRVRTKKVQYVLECRKTDRGTYWPSVRYRHLNARYNFRDRVQEHARSPVERHYLRMPENVSRREDKSWKDQV